MERLSKQERRELRRQRRRDKREGLEKTGSGNRKNITTGALVLLIAVSLGYMAYMLSTASGSYDNFAKCLSSDGVVIYGNDWCSYTKEQMGMFGNSFQYLNYVKCDDNPELCREKGVVKTPTWEINGNILSGVQAFETLSKESECVF